MSSTFSGGWQIWGDTEFAAYPAPPSLLRLTANGDEASVILLSSGKGFTVEVAQLVLANAKPPAKGFQLAAFMKKQKIMCTLCRSQIL